MKDKQTFEINFEKNGEVKIRERERKNENITEEKKKEMKMMKGTWLMRAEKCRWSDYLKEETDQLNEKKIKK